MTPKTETMTVAGWLFADVFLALAIIFLGASAQSDEYLLKALSDDGSTSTTTATTIQEDLASPTTIEVDRVTPATSTTVPDSIESLDPEFVLLSVPAIDVAALSEVGGDRAKAEADRIEEIVRIELADHIERGERVGISLTFGVDPDVGDGQEIARAFNAVVEARVPELFAGAALRNFDFRATDNAGAAKAELYFFVRG